MFLEWKNISIDVGKKNSTKELLLLDNVSGMAHSGKITSIMGPSGSGKTTLLNALFGRIPSGAITNGSILFNSMQRNTHQWIRDCGYVSQENELYETLTVEETVTYAAMFKLEGCDKDYIKSKVEQTINSMFLSSKSKILIKKLSGGEKKRVMIALQLISDPKVLLLDEPTSGLDNHTALMIMELLKQLAVECNKIVVLSIHQPSTEIFELFDQLILLCEGKAVYKGAAKDVEENFTKPPLLLKRDTSSVPDFIIEVVSDNITSEEKKQIYKAEVYKMVSKNQNYYGKEYGICLYPSFKNDYYVEYNVNWRHILIMIKRRCFLESSQKFAFWRSVVFKFLVIFATTLIYILLYTKTINIPMPLRTYMVLNFNTMMLLCILPTITIFYPENSLVKKEIANGFYSTSSYYLSVVFYQIFYNFAINLVPFLMALFTPSNISKTVIFLVYIVSLIPCVVFGTIIGSISKKKNLINVFSTVVQLLSIFGTSYWSLFTTITQTSKLNMLYKSLNFIYLLYLPFYFSQLVSLKLYWEEFNSTNKTPATINQQKNEIAWIWGKGSTAKLLYLWNILVLFFGLFIGICLLGRLLRPSSRMNLSKPPKTRRSKIRTI